MKVLFKIVFILSFLLGVKNSKAQIFADKEFYLIDSLVLDNLAQGDILLIQSSLKNYHKENENIEKILSLNPICENMVNENWIKYQIFQYKLILNELEKNHLDSNLIKIQKSYSASLNNIGYYHMNKGDVNIALKYYHQSLEIDKELKDSLGLASSLNNIGLIFKNQGDVAKCLEYYYACLNIREAMGDKKGIATSLHNIGAVYLDQNDDDKALVFCFKAKKIREEIGDKYGLGKSLNFAGFLYKNKKEYSKALECWNKSLMIREEIGDINGVAESVNNIGGYYRMKVQLAYESKTKVDSLQYNIQKALFYYGKGKTLYEKGGIKQGISNAYYHLADVQYYSNKKDALENALKALEIAQELGFPETIKNAALLLSKIYQAMGLGMKGLEMHQLYTLMKDSILNDQTQKSVLQQHEKYKYEKQKIIDDKENEKKVAIEKEKQEKQFIVLVVSLIAGFIVVILLVVIYRRLQLTKKQKLVIEEQKELLSETNEELNQTNEELATQRDEIERQKHIVEEQRDDIVSSITYAKRIQTAILPPANAINQYLPNNFVLYKPKDVVAGDFYWLETKGDDIFIAAADCTGHGVPGAMVSVVCHGALNRCVREYNLTKPSEILDKTRDLVLETFQKSEEQVKDGMDISLLKINFKTKKAEWAGANNPLYILRCHPELVEGQTTIEIIKPDKQPIGYVAEPKLFTNHTLDISNIQQIYLFTDGYADQFGGEKGKKMGYNTFREKLLEIFEKDMNAQNEILNEDFEKWKDTEEQVDDVCVIGIKI